VILRLRKRHEVVEWAEVSKALFHRSRSEFSTEIFTSICKE
jgi:hypothetical protein